jgi:cytochrome c oxidase subunit 4
MSGFNDGYPQYELMALHDEETGKVVRKKLWKVFWIMLVITIAELIIGFQAVDWGLSKTLLKIIFISLTIVKAAYIVLSFMHLGDETKP